MLKLTVKDKVVSFVIGSIGFIFLDIIWLKLTRKPFVNLVYQIREKTSDLFYPGIIISYSLLLLGFLVLILYPFYKDRKLKKSLFLAFVLGIVIYGFYEWLNVALFPGWSVSWAVIDTLWGGFLYTFSTFLAIFSLKYIKWS